MRAETIERLSAKGHFSSEQALALAEAMDTVIEKAQLVTVPILDSRLGVIDSRFADVDRRFAQINVRFDQVDARFAQIDVRFERMEARFTKVDARFELMEARFDAVNTRIDAVNTRIDGVNTRIDGLEARVKTGFEAVDIRFKVWSFRIILATLLGQAALGPVGLSALELAKRLLLTGGH
jgi:chromosome segregation ATPase